VRFFGRDTGFWRLAAACCILIALPVAAWIVLPGSLARLALLGLFALPIAFFLLDRPEIVFYLFTFVIFSNVDVYAPVPVFQSFAVFMIATLALAVVRGRELVLVDGRFIVLLCAFMLLAFQSLGAARDLGNAFHLFVKLAKVILCLLITTQFVGGRRRFRAFLVVIVAAVVANNLLPLVVPVPESYAEPSLIGSQGVIRYQGLILEPNAVAFLQVFCIPFYLFLAGFYRRPRIARWILAGALIVSLIVIVMSFSRGSLVAFALLLLLLLYSERRNKVLMISGLSIIVLIVIFVPSTYIVRARSILDALSNPASDYPIYTRLVTSGVALRLGAENLLTGVGLGNFLYHSAYYASFPFTVHNVPLLIFSEIGLLALGLFVAMIVLNVRILRGLAGRRNDGEARLLGRMLLLQQAAVLVNALFLPAIYDHAFWYTLALPALAAFAYRSGPGAGAPAAPGAGRLPAGDSPVPPTDG